MSNCIPGGFRHYKTGNRRYCLFPALIRATLRYQTYSVNVVRIGVRETLRFFPAVSFTENSIRLPCFSYASLRAAEKYMPTMVRIFTGPPPVPSLSGYCVPLVRVSWKSA